MGKNVFDLLRFVRRLAAALVVAALLTGCPDDNPSSSPPSSPPGSTGGGGGTPPGGGGTPGVVGTTTFYGGTLDELKALSPSLVFDHLYIAGALSLPLSSSTTISANHLTITSAGEVGYSYSSCQYVAAPNLSFSVANDVLIEGAIKLQGRSGTTVTETATCNSCYGQNGGDVTISGNSIKVSGSVSNGGGAGASMHFSFGGSSPCSAGGSGDLKLASGTTLDLSGASIASSAGKNFAGTSGPSGTANVSAGGAFTMLNGSINSTGAMTFSAASTDIWGVITYGTLNETIGGLPDVTAPAVTVLNPLPNAALPYNQAIDVKVQAPDAGMGLKNVRIKGLGYDKTHPLSDFVNSTLTATLTAPNVTGTATLDVTGTDNAGNVQTVSVTGLSVQFPAEIEPNDSLAQAQTLDRGGIIEGNVRNGDPGFVWNTGAPTGLSANKSGLFKVEDFYKVVCCEEVISGTFIVDRKISVSVDFSADAAGHPDIDVYLLNSTGTGVIASSVRDNVGLNSYTETISKSGFTSADMGKTFYIGVQAWEVPSATRYKITD